MPVITTLYAGILGLISLGLSYQAGSLRGKTGISIGHGENQEMLLAMRRHANFVEYVPLALILLGLLEMGGVTAMTMHIMGASLVVCRIAHAMGLKADTMSGAGRLIGAAGTAVLTLVASVWAIVIFIQA